MFTLLAVLAFVLLVVLGCTLVEILDPMPKAQAWGKAAYVVAVAAAPPVVPIVVVRDDGLRIDVAVEQAYAEFWREVHRRKVEEEIEQRELHTQWVAYRNWLRREKAAEDALGNEYEQALDARYGWGHNHYFADGDCRDQADLVADDYETRQAGKMRRAKSKAAKWTNQPDNSKPALVKLNSQHVSNDFVYVPGEGYQPLRVVEIKQEVFVYSRTLVPAGRSHNTKHINPHKGQARISELCAQQEEAWIAEQEQAEAIEALIGAMLHQ